MKCPHCLADLKYRDRRDGKCPQCQSPFALEPRDNALGLSDLRLRGFAERMSEQGKCWYTAAQLGYAIVRNKVKREPQFESRIDFIKIRFDFWTAFCVSAKFGSYAARNMFP